MLVSKYLPIFSSSLYVFASRPGQTSLKHRDRGQGTEAELKEKDFKRELEEREWEARAAKTRERGLGPGGSRVAIEAESRRALEGPSGSKKARTDAAPAAAANLVRKLQLTVPSPNGLTAYHCQYVMRFLLVGRR